MNSRTRDYYEYHESKDDLRACHVSSNYTRFLSCKECGHEEEVDRDYVLHDDERCNKCHSHKLTVEKERDITLEKLNKE